MISLLLALAGAVAPQEGQATLQSCEMTPAGWVCTYRMPPVTLVGSPVVGPPSSVSPSALPVNPPTFAPSITPVAADDKGEAARQARLIANCAEASWLSLCLPADRREAKRLQAAAKIKASLRGEVTQLLAKNQCPEAVKTALTGGDLALAREAREFCAP